MNFNNSDPCPMQPSFNVFGRNWITSNNLTFRVSIEFKLNFKHLPINYFIFHLWVETYFRTSILPPQPSLDGYKCRNLKLGKKLLIEAIIGDNHNYRCGKLPSSDSHSPIFLVAWKMSCVDLVLIQLSTKMVFFSLKKLKWC